MADFIYSMPTTYSHQQYPDFYLASPSPKRHYGRMQSRNTPPARHLATGQTGEDMAAAYLQGKGLLILARNWRPAGRDGGLELDIVATQGDTMVFTEVKTRTHAPNSAFAPQDAFTAAKRQKIFKAVNLYMQEHGLWHKPCRVDLLCVVIYPDNTCKLEHFENVLTLSQECGTGRALGGGNTPWQPW